MSMLSELRELDDAINAVADKCVAELPDTFGKEAAARVVVRYHLRSAIIVFLMIQGRNRDNGNRDGV
jgi:hypothetical protein